MYEHSYKLEEFVKGLIVYVEAYCCLPTHNGYWVIDVVPQLAKLQYE